MIPLSVHKCLHSSSKQQQRDNSKDREIRAVACKPISKWHCPPADARESDLTERTMAARGGDTEAKHREKEGNCLRGSRMEQIPVFAISKEAL